MVSFLAVTIAECATNGEVKLTGENGANTTAGRVEVFLNGTWGTVCGRKWGALDAQVACRQLGFDLPKWRKDKYL